MLDFTAYVQEIGRGGRNGQPCEATMYWSNRDIGKNTHTTDEMRQFVKSTECRRKVLVELFGSEFDSTSSEAPQPQECCDICEAGPIQPSKKKRGTKKSKQGNIEAVQNLLQQYFDIQNGKEETVFPSGITLLSTSVAKEISKNYTAYQKPEEIQILYPTMQFSYCKNMSNIINAFIDKTIPAETADQSSDSDSNSNTEEDEECDFVEEESGSESSEYDSDSPYNRF